MKMILGFLSGQKIGIYIDSNEEDDDTDDEDDSNPTKFNTNPRNRLTELEKNKIYSRKRVKHPSTTNSAIKCQNYKKKKRKKRETSKTYT